MLQAFFFIAVAGLFSVVVYLANKNGSKAAQLEVMKQELKKQAEERYHANKIMDNVRNMSADDVRSRLQDLSSK